MSPALAGAIHAFVNAAPCLLDLVQADDLAAETVAVNLPGTDMERANWRRKVSVPEDRLWTTEIGRAVLNRLRGRVRHGVVSGQP